MDLSAFSRMLARRGWLAIAGGLVGAVLGLALASLQAPGYEALTRIRLDLAKPVDFGQTQATKELIASFVEDIRAHDMADATAARMYESMGPDWMAARGVNTDTLHGMLFAGKLRVGADVDVYELKIEARAADPALAEAISLRWAETYVDRRTKANLQRSRDERVEAVLRDETSHIQYAPRRKLILGVAGLAGLLAGIALMLLLEYFESAIVRDDRDAERSSGLPLLGRLPAGRDRARGPGALRRGISELGKPVLALLRTGLPVLLLALLGAGSAWAFSQAQPSIYRSRARIAFEPTNVSNWGNAQAIRETMRGFKEDIKTRRMARQVIDALQLDLPEQRLLDDKRLNVMEDTGIYEVRIDVFHEDAATAQEISREWARQFIEAHRADDLQRDQSDRIIARLRDEVITADPWSPKPGVNSLAGAVLGALVGLAGVAFLESQRRHLILNPASAGLASGLPVLASIPPGEPE